MNNHVTKTIVTGYGVICAAGKDCQSLLESIKNKKTGINHINRFNTDGLPHNVGAIVSGFENTNATELDKDLAAVYAIEAINEALQKAQLDLTAVPSTRIALTLGNANCGMFSLMASINQGYDLALMHFPPHQITMSICRHFNICGPVMTFTSACTASSSAIAFAKQLIENGQADVVIAGGADALSELVYGGFQSVQSLSDTPCSPYGTNMGLSLGEGAGFLILEAEHHAHARGVKGRYQLLATGSSLDAHHATAPNPEGDGVRRAFEQTLSYSPVPNTDIRYINSHGTGTPANDGAELNGISNAIGAETMAEIKVSSSKAYFGHTLGAAGAIELISTLVAQEQGLLPATLHVDEIRECCQAFDIVKNDPIELTADVFAVTNSAFGGHNTSMILSQQTVEQPAITKHKVYLLGASMLNEQSLTTCRQIEQQRFTRFELKRQCPELYQRRMPNVAQFALGACHYALEDSHLEFSADERSKFGAYYANPTGSLETLDKSLESYESGISELKSTHFPNTVVNATLGQIAIGFGMKNSASCVSDLGNDLLQSLWSASYDMREGRCEYAIACCSQDDTELSQQIWQTVSFPSKLGNFATCAVLSNGEGLPDGYQPIAEFIDFIQISNVSDEQYFDALLDQQSGMFSKIGCIVLANHLPEHSAKLLSAIDRHLPQAELVQFEAQQELEHSSELAAEALFFAVNQQNSNPALDQTLLLSVNLAGCMTGCILRKVRN
ncbi:beta-ketoacyl synthase N-terminal-like domain-containing protein [Pseudoalteromonas sp. T1lg65]|uniref:beta-ketoacyl-[acyl-carrier-protein] synthase family protein n=1 Tax=Pseudoalteromonas sp. T1lg65 TaxID=2077101 RepID=UPI003F790838